jgi:DNA polymerase-3 subunit epsilon
VNAEFTAMIARRNWVVLDTETTGLDKPAEICQIAIVDGPTGQVLIDTFVNTVRPIPPAATAIHGIENGDVVDAPKWIELIAELKSILQGKDVVVYNAVYDRKLMHWSDEAAGLEHIEWKALGAWYCAMEAYAEHHGEINSFYGSYKWQKLSDAMRQQGLPVSDAHSALGDALMTRTLVLKVCGNELPADSTFEREDPRRLVGVPGDPGPGSSQEKVARVRKLRGVVAEVMRSLADDVELGLQDHLIREYIHDLDPRLDNNGQVERQS